jgi:hypothetical protein
LAAESPLVARFHAKMQGGLALIVTSSKQQRELIESAWAEGAQLVSANPQRRSLEELFVEWSEAGQAASQDELQ